MRIVVFGASGRTGRPLVGQALEAGHEVTAFVRDPARLPVRHERLRVVTGDVTDAVAVERTVAGQDAVISVLGPAKDAPKDVLTRGIGNIVAAMKRHGLRRLVSLTGAGVRDPEDRPKLLDRVIVAALKLVQRDVLEDGVRHAEVIKRSGLEWVVVRGPMLNEGEKTGEYRVGYVGKNSGSKISRADLADFMLGQLADDTYLVRMPMVSY
ncbi:MAG: NAD(P)-dependent oxidoreductase [Rubrobacter sp.]